MVRLLVEAGADKNQAMKDGATPLHIASQKGHGEVVSLLIEAGVSSGTAVMCCRFCGLSFAW